MSDPNAAAEERRVKAAERQARLLAKSQARLDKITGAAKGEGRIISDCQSEPLARFPSCVRVRVLTSSDSGSCCWHRAQRRRRDEGFASCCPSRAFFPR